MSRGMTSYSIKKPSLEFRLIRDILQEYPGMAGVMKKYFGEKCLERPSFKIKTLELACILLCVDQNRLIQEFEKIQH